MASIDEHKAKVSEYASSVDQELVDALAKTYRLVLSNKDSQYVACGDPAELATVRENFLKKKLGLSFTDEDLDTAIKDACDTMKADKFKSRLVMYYLLTEKFNAKSTLV